MVSFNLVWFLNCVPLYNSLLQLYTDPKKQPCIQVVGSVSLLIVNRGRVNLAVEYFKIEPAMLCHTIIVNVKKSNIILIYTVKDNRR